MHLQVTDSMQTRKNGDNERKYIYIIKLRLNLLPCTILARCSIKVKLVLCSVDLVRRIGAENKIAEARSAPPFPVSLRKSSQTQPSQQSHLRMRASSLLPLRWAIPFRPSWSRPSSGIVVTRAFTSHSRPGPAPPRLRPSSRGWRCFSASTPAQFNLEGDSTIYALSTASGRAAIAVVRVSGSACVSVIFLLPFPFQKIKRDRLC